MNPNQKFPNKAKIILHKLNLNQKFSKKAKTFPVKPLMKLFLPNSIKLVSKNNLFEETPSSKKINIFNHLALWVKLSYS